MKKRWFAALAAALVAAVPLSGAQQEKPKESRTAYVRRIYEKDRASYGDACRAILSLAAGEHTDADFVAIQKDLTGRAIVEEVWGLGENSPLTKGTLAAMLCRTLGIKGGLTASLFGLTRRYALRECLHIGLMESGMTEEHISGREFIDVMTNGENYKSVQK
jgi:hypothetical protein